VLFKRLFPISAPNISFVGKQSPRAGDVAMYLIEWLCDLEVIEKEKVEAATVSAAIAKARANWNHVVARVRRQPDRFRVKDQQLKELAVVALRQTS
jgi:hypothetical protein